MADDKRNREQPQSDQSDRQRIDKDRKPGSMDPPGSGRARREDEEESQE
jgi:hypothetical protein